MTPEAQNIALAKACYWTHVGDNPWLEQGRPVGIKDEKLSTIPNFAADLNAQFEAWQKLTEEQKLMFGDSVERISLRDGIRKEEAQYRFGCECLLRALGKWIE